MKLIHTIAATAAYILFSAHAYAACASLDYQELKEMSTEELKSAYCKASKDASKALQASIDTLSGSFSDSGSSDISYNQLSDSADQCTAQKERIGRLLTKRDIQLKELCRQ
jgi:hypothetical protein